MAQLQSLQASSKTRVMSWCKSNMHTMHTFCCALDQTSINPEVRWQQKATLCSCIDNIVVCVMAAVSQSLSLACNCSSQCCKTTGYC